jgi:hypothetical protein
MLFMNEDEINEAAARHVSHPVLGPATRFLRDFKDEVNAHSDGWPYWSPPVRAAARLMALIEGAREQLRDGHPVACTLRDVQKALPPIKAFMTRRGTAAGMTLPSTVAITTTAKQENAFAGKSHTHDALRGA